VIAHGPRPPDRVDLGDDALTDPQRAVQDAALDDEAADWPLGVSDLEHDLAAERQRARSDLATALGVERRPVGD
jgi:hypothetical protein